MFCDNLESAEEWIYRVLRAALAELATRPEARHPVLFRLLAVRDLGGWYVVSISG